MVDDTFKLPGASYETLSRIVQAYNHVGGKTNLETVAGIAGSPAGEISRNTGFLVSVGVLEGGRDKGVTAVGQKLARALDFREANDISAAWREVLSGQTIIQRIIAAIRVRGGMDASTLATQIVYTAGADKSTRALAGAAAVIEMMKQAGLVAERDGQVVALNISESATPVDEPVRPPGDAPMPSPEPLPIQGPTVQRVIEQAPGGTSVALKLIVNISVEPSQLPDLGVQIRTMLDSIERAADELEGLDGDDPR
ncbi:hypothetical protein [Georgenia ruanii]|uniref:hypothetical protein n=1 Tax=Georgenia ruanii TaxID=348442 RepID=UPI0012645EDC|nr:hypothetical protein [Georgenia ruanii]